VLVVPHTKVFHVAGCTFIHDKEQGLKSMTASEAEEEGYVPCVRCLGKYLIQTATDYLRKRGWVAA
jgi:methylphosphotriester-DNA--protein-cysteine methyltransferase